MKIEVGSCPCCGSDDLHLGASSAMSYDVRCNVCGLEMNVSIRGDAWPPEAEAAKTVEDKMRITAEVTVREAVRRWNQRVPQRPTDAGRCVFDCLVHPNCPHADALNQR